MTTTSIRIVSSLFINGREINSVDPENIKYTTSRPSRTYKTSANGRGYVGANGQEQYGMFSIQCYNDSNFNDDFDFISSIPDGQIVLKAIYTDGTNSILTDATLTNRSEFTTGSSGNVTLEFSGTDGQF